MTDAHHCVVVLNRALDQMGDVLAAVRRDQLGDPTPCPDWDVANLVGHVVASPRNFLMMMRGEQPDWSAGPEPATEGWTAQFRAGADDLIHHWHQRGDSADPGQADWQTAEMAVHAWDVARATGQTTENFDPDVAERGMGFMSQGLTADNRGEAFGPEQEAPPDAGPYERLAAFAGRDAR